MASFRWVGRAPEDFGGWVEGKIDRNVNALKREVDDAVDEGKELTKQNLDKATTKTGQSGYPQGRGSAGRNVTGDMINKVSAGAADEGNTYMGFWGWTSDVISPKIFAQELGGSPSAIPAANSLRDSFMVESQKAQQRMSRIWKSGR